MNILRYSNRPVKKREKCLVIGSYGRGNAGDDIFLASAVSMLGEYELYINSADDTLLPDIAQRVFRTISTTKWHDFLKKLWVFITLKKIMYWGGDVWVELLGSHFQRRSLYKMVALNALARLAGKRIYYVGCGLGDLHGYSLFLARLSARMARKIAVREQRTAAILRLPQVSVLPDLATTVPFYRPRLHKLPPKGQSFVICLSLLYFIPDPAQNFTRYLETFAQFIEHLPPQRYTIVLLPMLVAKNEPLNDEWVAQQLQAMIPNNENVEIHVSSSLKDAIETLGNCHLVIGTRLHANILATLNATPCLGISYRPKVRSFFHDNNLDAYCLDFEELPRLEERFGEIYRNYATVAEKFLAASTRNLQERVAYQQFVQQF